MMTDEAKRKRPVSYDEAPAIITDHAFVPRGRWWELCEHCGLAQAAHSQTTIDSFEEIRKEQEEVSRTPREREPIIAYYSDDNPELFE